MQSRSLAHNHHMVFEATQVPILRRCRSGFSVSLLGLGVRRVRTLFFVLKRVGIAFVRFRTGGHWNTMLTCIKFQFPAQVILLPDGLPQADD